ncbi:MAG: DUF3108 domain-containing protein [bacterium]
MKFFVPVCFAVISIMDCSCRAQEDASPMPNPLSLAPEVVLDSSAPPVPWKGETLEYEISWGFIKVGTSDMSAKQTVMVSSRPCYHIVSTAKSGSVIDTFYKVRDLNESWMDAFSFISMGYSKNIREGGYRRREWVVFDQENRVFRAESVGKSGTPSFKEGPLPGPVHDMLSSLYFVRSRPLEVGRDIIMDVNSTKNWPLVVKVIKKEKVKTPAGKFECFLLEPKLREEGIFVAKGKRLRVWLTADEDMIPVQMKAEVFIGHVSAELVRRTVE